MNRWWKKVTEEGIESTKMTISWNVNGLHVPSWVKTLRFSGRANVWYFCLQETKLQMTRWNGSAEAIISILELCWKEKDIQDESDLYEKEPISSSLMVWEWRSTIKKGDVITHRVRIFTWLPSTRRIPRTGGNDWITGWYGEEDALPKLSDGTEPSKPVVVTGFDMNVAHGNRPQEKSEDKS